MQEKVIHIVFQVLNFLSSSLSDSYRLTAPEKLLLIFLAKYKGTKGIYPSLQTLARELKIDYRNVRRALNNLKKKQLVLIDYVPGKSSNYSLLLPSNLSTTEGVNALTTENIPRAHTPSHPGRKRPHTQGAHAPLLDIGSNKLITESERKPRARPLSLDFENSKEDHEVAKALGLTHAEEQAEFEKFIEYYVNNGAVRIDWHKELQNWFGKYEQYKLKKARTGKKDEPRSTVREYQHSEETVRSDPVVVKNALKGIMAKLKGRSTDDGLGSEGEGEEG